MNSEFDTWYTDYIDDDNKSVREAAKAAWIFMQSRIEALEKDAARWRELLTNDFFVVCTSELDEIFKSKLERVIDTAMQSEKVGV